MRVDEGKRGDGAPTQIVPSAVSITTLHCPEAQRWNDVVMQFHSPSEQAEPTVIWPPPRSTRTGMVSEWPLSTFKGTRVLLVAAAVCTDAAMALANEGRRRIPRMAREVNMSASRRLPVDGEPCPDRCIVAGSTLASTALIVRLRVWT